MSTINGKVCVANGRNLLLDTDFNNLPQYWTLRAGTVTGTFNGHNVIYYDARNITAGLIDVLQQPIYDPALTTNRVLPSRWYTLSFYTKGVGQMITYVYGSFVDTGAGSYIDGVRSNYVGGDGNHIWDLTDDWIRHTYTFKSKASLSNTYVQNVLWRLFKGNEAYICMPKLDAGKLATPYSPEPVDKVFSNGRQVYGRNLLLDTNFNNLPQYWTARAGTVTGTFNGHNIIYYDATTITFDSADVLQQLIYDPALTTNRVLPSSWYTLSFYAKGSGQITTYVYSNFVDSYAGGYIDGVKEGYMAGDGSHEWNLTDDWVRHTYTIKSKSSFPSREAVLWRLFKGNTAYICMPKLETGTLATPWTPAPEDVM